MDSDDDRLLLQVPDRGPPEDRNRTGGSKGSIREPNRSALLPSGDGDGQRGQLLWQGNDRTPELFNIQHIRTVAYTPQLNSYIERFHGWLMATLTTQSNNLKIDWHKWLPVALYIYRTTTHATTGYSPLQILTGREPVTNLDLAFTAPRPCLGVPDYMTELEENMTKLHRDVRRRQQRARLANLERRRNAHTKREFAVNDFVLIYSPSRAEKLPNHLPRVRKLLDRFLGPYKVVKVTGEGPRKRYTVLNTEEGRTEEYRGETLSLYTPWNDEGEPSVPRRQYMTRDARRTMNAQEEEKYRPRMLQSGDMVVFPRQMADDTPGFGIARVLRRDGADNCECQWYSNGSSETPETLSPPFLPCWDTPTGWYAAAQPRHSRHSPLTTSDSYGWNINRDVVADAGFELTEGENLPQAVYRRMKDHRLFKWRNHLPDSHPGGESRQE